MAACSGGIGTSFPSLSGFSSNPNCRAPPWYLLCLAFADPLSDPFPFPLRDTRQDTEEQSRDAVTGTIPWKVEQPQMHVHRFEAVNGAVRVLRAAKHAVELRGHDVIARLQRGR